MRLEECLGVDEDAVWKEEEQLTNLFMSSHPYTQTSMRAVA